MSATLTPDTVETFSIDLLTSVHLYLSITLPSKNLFANKAFFKSFRYLWKYFVRLNISYLYMTLRLRYIKTSVIFDYTFILELSR